MLKRIGCHALFLIGVALIISTGVCIDFLRYVHTPLVTQTKIVILEPAMSFPSFIRTATAQPLPHPWYLNWLMRWKNPSRYLQAGEYQLVAGTTPLACLMQLKEGRVVLHPLTIVEGWTLTQLWDAMQSNPAIKHTLSDMHDLKSVLQLPHEPEGLFYPDTYRFAAGTPDTTLLKYAHSHLDKLLSRAFATRASGLPYDSPYQALIIASMIEKETALAEEKPLIASVICNRLRKGMRLQIDATVIYGLGLNYRAPLTRADLKKVTPYNTYTQSGFPPTPIAMPSLSSIVAATHPAETQFLYYVAKGDGAHAFSSSLAEHNKAITRYRSH